MVAADIHLPWCIPEGCEVLIYNLKSQPEVEPGTFAQQIWHSTSSYMCQHSVINFVATATERICDGEINPIPVLNVKYWTRMLCQIFAMCLARSQSKICVAFHSHRHKNVYRHLFWNLNVRSHIYSAYLSPVKTSFLIKHKIERIFLCVHAVSSQRRSVIRSAVCLH